MSIEYKEWVKYSEKDFIAAQFLMTAVDPPIEILCYPLSTKCRKFI